MTEEARPRDAAAEPYSAKDIDYWRKQVAGRKVDPKLEWTDGDVMLVVSRFLATLDAAGVASPEPEKTTTERDAIVHDRVWASGYSAGRAAAIRGVATQPELDELRALSDAATPGPWVAVLPAEGDEWYLDTHAYPSGPEPVWTPPQYPISSADAALIVTAVNYVRRALAETLRSRQSPTEGGNQ